MAFNTVKFELLRYTRGNDPVDFEYKAGETTTITSKSKTVDLGVTMSDTCSFKEHVRKTAAAGRGKVGFIYRTFKTRKREHILPLYKAIALPILEYCSPLWCLTDSHSMGLIRELENVQRSLTRYIEGMVGLD